jgi:alpha-L-fucosidase
VFDDKPKKGDWNQYLAYQHAQLSELLTNYGKVGGIRFDGWWDRQDLPNADWRLEKTYQLIHQLQPAALIGNHHHQPPFPGEDFQMFEKDLPGENAAGYSGQSKVGKLPLQTCETMNISWGFNLKDNKYKSTKNLIHYPVKAAGYNSNFLLNIGPMPNGKVQPEFVSRLQEIGKWMDKNGKPSTVPGPVKYSQTAQGIVLVLPEASPAEVDRIIELEVE